MKIKELEKTLAALEGKKTQVKIGDIRELVGILSDIIYKEYFEGASFTVLELINNGKKRALKNKPKARK